MGKYRYLLKNMGLLTIGSFSTKILTFLLVPLYTNILTTGEYGTYDLINTIVTLLLPIFTLNIGEAVLRFSVGNSNNNDLSQVFCTGLKYITYGSICLIFLVYIVSKFNLLWIIRQYGLFLILLYIAQAYNQLFVFFARGIDRLVEITIASIISTIITVSLNIYFLVYLKMGLNGYFYASIMGIIIPNIYFILKLKIWRYVRIKRMNRKLCVRMTIYSVPLILNTVGWWINNASDRFVVTWLCGVAENGIYSVAYKIPAILSVFQNIFNQAWMLSSVKEYDKNDDNGFFKTVYTYYNFLMCLVCSFIIIFIRILAKFLFAKDFFVAWKYAPLLTISVIFGTMSGVLGGVFTAVKDTKTCGITTAIGAVVNLILNLILVYYMGPLGAAIATLLSFIVVWLIRMKQVKKYMQLRINIYRDLVGYVVLILQTLVGVLIGEKMSYYIIQLFLLSIMMFGFRKEVGNMIRKIRGR